MIIKKWNYSSKNVRWRKLKKGSGFVSNLRIQELQKQLQENMKKAIMLAEKNTIRNSDGKVVISVNDEWRRDN